MWRLRSTAYVASSSAAQKSLQATSGFRGGLPAWHTAGGADEEGILLNVCSEATGVVYEAWWWKALQRAAM